MNAAVVSVLIHGKRMIERTNLSRPRETDRLESESEEVEEEAEDEGMVVVVVGREGEGESRQGIDPVSVWSEPSDKKEIKGRS